MANEQLAKRYLELGALFVAVGVDTTLLARGAKRWRHVLSKNRLRQLITINPSTKRKIWSAP